MSPCKYCGTPIYFKRTGFKLTPMKDGDPHTCARTPRNAESIRAQQAIDLEKATDEFLRRNRKRRTA